MAGLEGLKGLKKWWFKDLSPLPESVEKNKDTLRLDGTSKGPGFLGTLKRPDGKVSTEISIGVNFDGKEVLIPALVPTLNQNEIKWLLKGNDPTPRIIHKATQHAIQRMKEGKSPFKSGVFEEVLEKKPSNPTEDLDALIKEADTLLKK